MDSVIADFVRIGVISVAFILLLKMLLLRVRVPGLSEAIAAV